MFSVKKDRSFKLNRQYSRFTYYDKHPVLYVNKLGLFDFFRSPIKVQNISQSGLLAKVSAKVTFSLDEKLILEFDNYFTEAIPISVIRWDPERRLLAIKFSRKIKLIERMALNIA